MVSASTLATLQLASLISNATVAGLLISVSTITVPTLTTVSSKAKLTGTQRYWLWRRFFQTGAATFSSIPIPVLASAAAAVAAYFATPANAKDVALCYAMSAAATSGVAVITPIVMLGADLRKDLLENEGGERNDEKDDILAKQTVDRFYRFHGVRIGLGVLGTLFSALGLYRSMTL